MISSALLLASWLTLIGAVPVDNGVEGDIEIECGPTGVTVAVPTRNGFEGNVYVKGFFASEECKTVGGGRQTTSLDVGFDECGTRRQRSLSPKGVFVTANVVVSFHPLFMTKVDRAYKVQCFYMEADKTVDTGISVSMLTTQFATAQIPMPQCTYDILDGPDGQPVEFAVVGQSVYHKWDCASEFEDTFCMVVRDCFVDDGAGDTVDLVGVDGCADDLYLITNPEYTADLMAGVEAHVFKYADRSELFFRCQITILVKDPGEECPRPVCPTPAGRGAGEENPAVGALPTGSARPNHPFPLVPGSPYLPARKRRAAASVAEKEVKTVGTVDVVADLSSLGLHSQQDGRQSATFDKNCSVDCVSPLLLYATALVAAVSLMALSALVARSCFV